MPKYEQCAFCTPSSRFQTIMTTALFEKYSTSSNFYFSRQVDDLLNDAYTEQTTHFHQILLQVNHCQFMKRQYEIQEFPCKIEHYGEYYKFNRDIPRCFDRDLLSPLMRYHEQLKKLNFRKVKNAIKKEQGVSITSQHDSSSLQDSGQSKCSNYGNVLKQLRLQNSSDSIALNNICAEIGSILGKTKTNYLFKGTFEQDPRSFEAFVQKQLKKPIFYGKRHQRIIQPGQRQQKSQGKSGFQFFKLKPLTTDKKIGQKNSIAQQLSRDDKQRKENMERISPFQPLDVNKFTHTLHNFIKINQTGKYQSIKAKNLLNINKKVKIKSFRKSQQKMKAPKINKCTQEEKNIFETERFHRDDSKKTFRKNSTLKQLSENKNQIIMNENRNSHIGNQIAQNSKEKRLKMEHESKSLSRSKSRVQLSKSKQGLSCQSSKRITRTPSNLTDNSFPKIKAPQKSKEANKMNNLVNKKLALYLKC